MALSDWNKGLRTTQIGENCAKSGAHLWRKGMGEGPYTKEYKTQLHSDNLQEASDNHCYDRKPWNVYQSMKI